MCCRRRGPSVTPPSTAIAALVLGGPEVVRVVLNSSSSGSRAWGSGECARCVEQQLQQRVNVKCFARRRERRTLEN